MSYRSTHDKAVLIEDICGIALLRDLSQLGSGCIPVDVGPFLDEVGQLVFNAFGHLAGATRIELAIDWRERII
jgi:hypothetical protein